MRELKCAVLEIQTCDDVTKGQQGVGSTILDRLAPPQINVETGFKIRAIRPSQTSSGFFSFPVIHLKHIWSNKTCSHVTLTALLLLGGAAEQTY